MTLFDYSALDAQGERKMGLIDAPSIEAAQRKLNEEGFSSLSIEAHPEELLFCTYTRPDIKETAQFFKQLTLLIDSGVSPLRSLQAIEVREESALSNIRKDLITQLERGESLHNAFASHPEAFDDICVAAIKAGEEQGNLPWALEALSNYFDDLIFFSTSTLDSDTQVTARFSSALHTLLRAGVPEQKSFALAGQFSHDRLVNTITQREWQSVDQLWEEFEKQKALTPMALMLFETGAVTGRLEQMASKVAEYHKTL